MIKDKLTLLEEKLRKHCPISMGVVDYAIQWMIDNNSTFSRAGLIEPEYKKETHGETFENGKELASDFLSVIGKYGYVATWRYPQTVPVKGSHYNGFAIYIFSSKESFDKFQSIRDWTYNNKENHKYQHLDIYKKVTKAQQNGTK